MSETYQLSVFTGGQTPLTTTGETESGSFQGATTMPSSLRRSFPATVTNLTRPIQSFLTHAFRTRDPLPEIPSWRMRELARQARSEVTVPVSVYLMFPAVAFITGATGTGFALFSQLDGFTAVAEGGFAALGCSVGYIASVYMLWWSAYQSELQKLHIDELPRWRDLHSNTSHTVPTTVDGNTAQTVQRSAQSSERTRPPRRQRTNSRRTWQPGPTSDEAGPSRLAEGAVPYVYPPWNMF